MMACYHLQNEAQQFKLFTSPQSLFDCFWVYSLISHSPLFGFAQSIFNNHLLDVNVRWLAVLYFKNGIDRYWRRVAPQ